MLKIYATRVQAPNIQHGENGTKWQIVVAEGWDDIPEIGRYDSVEIEGKIKVIAVADSEPQPHVFIDATLADKIRVTKDGKTSIL